MNTKGVYLSIKYDRLYANIESKFRFNPIKILLQLYKTSVLHELSLTFFKVYFKFEKKFQTLQKIGVLFLNTYLTKFFKFIKFLIQTDQ